MLLSRNGINMRLCMGRVFAHLTSLQSAIGCTSRATMHQLRGRSSLQVQFGTKNHCVFFFEQTDQARPVRLFLDLEVTRVWYCAKKWRTNRRFSSVTNRLPAALMSQPLGILKGELQNEYRNGSSYRPGSVLAWWRRLVLGPWARLTRLALKPR